VTSQVPSGIRTQVGGLGDAAERHVVDSAGGGVDFEDADRFVIGRGHLDTIGCMAGIGLRALVVDLAGAADSSGDVLGIDQAGRVHQRGGQAVVLEDALRSRCA